MRNQQEDKEALREETPSWCKKNKKASDVQCSNVVSEQVTWDFSKNHSSLNGKIENIENLRCDLTELIEMRRSASRQHVREVITSDINLLTNKTESLKDDVLYAEISVPQWTEVAAGRTKLRSHTRHSEPKPIPVIQNRYESLNATLVNMQTQTQWKVAH